MRSFLPFSWDTNEIGWRGTYCSGVHSDDSAATTSGSSSEACWRASSSGSDLSPAAAVESAALHRSPVYCCTVHAAGMRNFAAYSDTCCHPDHHTAHQIPPQSSVAALAFTETAYSGILNTLGPGNHHAHRITTGCLRLFEKSELAF